MGNQVSAPAAALDCCTAMDIGDDEEGPRRVNKSQFGSQAGSRSSTEKPDRGVCRELTGESLFTECMDDRCGTGNNRDRAGQVGRRRADFYAGVGEGLPPGYTVPVPLAHGANGAVPIYIGGEDGSDPVW